jgi:hypothetical protein
MAQYFEIKKNSTLPSLRVGLIDDGTYDFCRRDMYNNAIQNADITFSMKDENGVLKISKAKASIVKCCDCNCTESYSIEYKWNKRDTKEAGVFDAFFEINFKNDLYEEGVSYPEGNLIMPIHEQLKIHILE